MKIEKIKESLYHVYECEYPLWNNEVCSEIKDHGIDSLLVLQEDDGPFPFLQSNGLWSYKRPIKSFKNLLIHEKYKIYDFINYESIHNRKVAIYIKTEDKNPIDLLLPQIEDIDEKVRPYPEDSQCCFGKGCKGDIVCHGTTLNNFKNIITDMELKSKNILNKRIDTTYSIKENVGDPEDFSNYIMFANGNCVAPEFVIESRRQHRFLLPDEVFKVFHPGVRLFYEFKKIYKVKNKAFDGIHPIKIEEKHELTLGLLLISLPEYDNKNSKLTYELSVPKVLENKIEYFDNRGKMLYDWCNCIYNRAVELSST